jgi:tetratricopeptide (TPR) repeat protein
MVRVRQRSVAMALAATCALVGSLAFGQQPRRGAAAQAAPVEEVAIPTVATVAADVCIAPEARARALECPAGSQRYGSHRDTAPPAAARATERPTHAAETRRPGQRLDRAMIMNQQTMQRRSAELLLAEARLTASLVQRMSTTDTHRPDTLMRLAEDYQELAQLANGQAEDLEDDLFAARQAHNEAGIADITRRQAAFRATSGQYREQLIAAFRNLVDAHPNYAAMDRALFYLAFAYQDGNDFNNARTVYRTLIQRFPQSPFVPNAYLSFAEYFFEQGEMENARQFYERVLAVQDEHNQVYGYALYKMAWVLYNLQDFEGSLNKFYEVIDYGRSHPNAGAVTALLRNARMELVTVYGSVYGTAARPLNVGNAFATFQRYAADEENSYAMFEKLAELYQDAGQWPNAVASYHGMMERRANSDRFCFWQSQVARAIIASRPKPDQLVEVNRLIDVYNTFRASSRSTEVKTECRNQAARVTFDVASHWHLEAVGRSAEGAVQTRGTRSPETMRMTVDLYQKILDEFPEFDQVEFTEYDRRDWPTRYRIAYYRADMLRDMGDNERCGPAYDAVVEMNPGGEFTEDAAYKAVLCYNDSFSENFRNAVQRNQGRQNGPAANTRGQTDAQRRNAERVRVVPRDLNPREQAMLRAFTRYVCFVSPDGAQRSPEGDDPRTVMLTIKYRRAYVYYVANHFEEAATLFKDVAESDGAAPDPENLREISADLYLDSLNVMGDMWNPTRPACYDAMSAALPDLMTRFCTPALRPQHDDFCRRVEELQCQVLRKKAESLHTATRHAESAGQYVSIVRTHRECGRLDEMLYNAAIEYDEAFLLGRAMRVRERLVAIFLPRNSPWAQRALYRLAGNYHAIQVFGRAAELYEQYAEYVNNNRQVAVRAAEAAHAAAPNVPLEDPVQQAADALRQATLFRIGLGEEDHALQNAQKFARYFGRDPARRRVAANVVFSIGQIYTDRVARLRRSVTTSSEERHTRDQQIRQAWNDLIRHYEGYIRTYAAQGTLDQKIQGNVALARGYWNVQNIREATTHYQQAVEAWGTTSGEGEAATSTGQARIRQELGDEAGDAIERSKDSVAEARFYLAEVLYQRFQNERFPRNPGTTRRAFDAWVVRSLTPYIQLRQQLLDAASAKYVEVVNMHVPNWEIAAVSRLADMYYQFAQTIRNAPIPPDIQRNADLLDAYRLVLDQRTQPFMNTASEGFQRCIRTATQVHWFNEWSQLCERELYEIDRVRFPLADEIRVEPNLVFSRPINSRPVYQLQTASEGEEEPAEQGQASPGAAQ